MNDSVFELSEAFTASISLIEDSDDNNMSSSSCPTPYLSQSLMMTVYYTNE
jgi:hypothetical protein